MVYSSYMLIFYSVPVLLQQLGLPIYNFRWEWIKELRNMAQVIAVKVHTTKNIADLLTKCQQRPTIDKFLDMMNVLYRSDDRKQ